LKVAASAAARISTWIIQRQSFDELNSCTADRAIDRATDVWIFGLNDAMWFRVFRAVPAQNNDGATTLVADR
jgi:hypothetical protein